MNKKFFLYVSSLPLILAGLNFGGAQQTSGESDTFTGTTFDYAHTSDEAKVGYIDGETLIKQLKKSNNGTTATPFEIEFAKRNYRVRYDKIDFGSDVPFNYGKVTSTKTGETNYYVEGFVTDDYEPARVEVNNHSYDFSSEFARYQTIAVVGEQSLEGGDVIYNHHIKLDTETANEILNGAYYAALNEKKLDDEWNDYQDYLTYEQNLADYTAYLKGQEAVEIKRANVEAYKAAYQTYLTDKANYEDYLDQLDTYNTKVQKYLTYQDDLYAYNLIKEQIELEKQKYETDMQTVAFQNSLMDYFFDANLYPNITADKTIYACLQTDAVKQVMNESNEGILALGAKVDGSIFKSARNANSKVSSVLDEYKAGYYQKNRTDKDKYDFYIRNYLALKINLEKLTQCLEELNRNPQVRNEMEKRGKTAKYNALLAQLIFVSNLFEYPSSPAVYKKTDRFIGLDYVIDNKSICTFLGIDEPDLTGKVLQPLGAYPTNPTTVYGDEPNYTDDKYGLLDSDFEQGQLIKPTEVAKPIEPALKDFNIVAADVDAQIDDLQNPVDAKYFDNDGNLIAHDKPATIPTGRHTEDSILSGLFDELNGEILKFQTRFNDQSDVSVLTFDKEESFKINNKVTESNLAIMWVNVAGQDPYCHELAYYKNSDASDLVLKHEIPPEAIPDQAGFFNVWQYQDDLTRLAEDGELFVTAVKQQLQTYNIKWYDYDDKSAVEPLYETDGYEKFLPSLVDNNGVLITPNKAAISSDVAGQSGKIHFKFNSFVDVNGNSIEGKKCEQLDPQNGIINLYIKFDSEYYPCVKFVNSITNEIIHQYDDVKPNTRVYCETPKIEATSTESYKFSHWEYEGAETSLPIQVSDSDIVVKAMFIVTHYYNVVFKDEDGTVLSERIYAKVGDELGEMPIEPETPTKSFSDNKFYEFAGWDKTVTNVSKNEVYTATYSNTNIIADAEIERNDNKLTITVDNSKDSIDVSSLAKLLGEGYTPASADIVFNDGTVSLSESSFRQIYANDIKTIKFDVNEVSGSNVYSLEVLDTNDEETTLNATVTVASSDENDHLKAFVGTSRIALSHTNSAISFNINANEDVRIAKFYRINADSYSNATFYVNGVAFDAKNIPEIESGCEVAIKANPTTGYELSKLAVNDGNEDITSKEATTEAEKAESTLTFTIEKDVVLSATTERIQFTVTFHVGDTTSTTSGPIGTIVMLPTPTKEDTSEIHYVFKKWTELDEGTASIVLNGNIDLHAEFEEHLLKSTDEIMQSAKDIQALILGCILGTAGVGFLFGLILLIAKRPKDDDDDDIENNNPKDVRKEGDNHEKKIK